jgi:hypothetical protein
VKTPADATGVALVGPWERLPAGSYVGAATADILGGGLTLTAATRSGTVLASDRYWWNQDNRFASRMINTFTLTSPARVQITVANWAPRPTPSRLVLRSLSLDHLLVGAPPPPQPQGPTGIQWDFNGGTPPGVETVTQYSRPASPVRSG